MENEQKELPKKETLSVQDLVKLASEKKLIGFFPVNNDDYHAGPGISKSDLDEIRKSPAHLASKKLAEKPKTAALLFGSQFHTYVLEPHLFEWEVLEGVKTTKKEGKISEPDMRSIERMKTNIMKNKYAKECLRGIREQACYWVDPTTGILCKCKPDIMAHHKGLGIDLKSSTNNDVLKFQWVAKDRRYDVQGCFYLDGVFYASQQSGEILFEGVLDSFLFIVCEKEPPHSLKTMLISTETLKRARAKYKEDLEKYKRFFGLDPMPNWNRELPGYEEKLESLDI